MPPLGHRGISCTGARSSRGGFLYGFSTSSRVRPHARRRLSLRPRFWTATAGSPGARDLRWNTPPIGQAITRIESLTQRNVVNAQQTADGASEMTTQMESTRKFLDELVAVVGLESA